jgi:hypothetical protein
LGNAIYWNTGDSTYNPFRTQGDTANVTWQEYNNTWTHFAVVNNSSTLSASLYINGKLTGSAAYRNPTTDDGIGDLTVGGYVYSSATNYNFKGEIDDFRIYTGSLSSKQVESIYLSPDSGTGRTIISGDSISTGHLRSNNWGPSFGSEFNLNSGTFKLGGSTDPKLSWNGSQLVVKGQIQIQAGSTLPDGATLASLASCVISSDTQIFAFDDSNDITPTPSTATITVQQANQLSDIVSGDITVTNGTKSNFSHAPGTSTGTGTATVTVTPDGTGTYPVTVTVANDGITDTITLHKVQGGTNAYTVILSNEAHTLAAPTSGIVSSYAGSGTTISVYKGVTELNSIATGTPTSGQFKVTATGTGITPNASPDTTGNPTVFGDALAMSANNASISFAVNIENVTTITKVQSFAKSTAGTNGTDGADGRVVNLTCTDQVFTYDTSGATPDPADTTITATALNTTGTVKYQFFKNDVSVQALSTTSTYPYTPQTSFANMPDKIEVQITDDGDDTTIQARDQLTISAIKPGANGDDAMTIILSNEAHTLPTDNDGNVTYTGSGTTIALYEGTTQLTYDGVGTSNGTWTIAAAGTNIAVGDIADSGAFATVGGITTHSNMTATTASILYTITGKRADGTSFTFTKSQSFAKSIQGATGNTGNAGSTGPVGPNFGFLTGSLSQVTPTIAAGLLMTDEVFGYHTGITANEDTDAKKLNKFTSLLDNIGNFYLGSGSGAGHLTWENATSVLTVSGTINATAGNIGGFKITADAITGSQFFLSGSAIDNQFFISSSKFNVKASGDITASSALFSGSVSITGDVNAKTGTIGGFRITADAITGSQFFLSGSAIDNQFFISSSKFNIKASGDITASSALFTGSLHVGNSTSNYLKFNATDGLQISGDITVSNPGDFADPDTASPNFPTENLLAYYPLDKLHVNDANGDNVNMILDEAYNPNRPQTNNSINGATAPYHSDDVTSGYPVLTTNGFTDGSSYAPNSPLTSAMRFDGVDDRVKINSLAGAFYDNMDISVSFWMFHAGGSDETPFHFADGGSNDLNIFLNHDNVNNKIKIHVNGTGYEYNEPIEWTNTWRHVALTIQNGASNSSTMKFYLNGSLRQTWTGVQDTGDFGDIDEAVIGLDLDGAGFGAPGNWFEGAMGQFRVYDKVLTQANITSLYNNPNGQQPPKFITFKDDFGGQEGVTNATQALSANRWVTGGSTATIEQVDGVLKMKSTGTTAWDAAIRSHKVFNRIDCDTLVCDITILDVELGSPYEPRMMLGWGNANSVNTNSYSDNAHAIYFSENNIKIYDGTDNQGNILTNAVADGDKFRVEITPNKDSGFHGKIYRFSDLTTTIATWNTHVNGDGNTYPSLDVGVWSLHDTNTFQIDQIYVESKDGVGSTIIKGDSISTGKLQSTNYGSSAGSEFDLNSGTFKLGGSDDPKLSWDGTTLAVSGEVSASSGRIGGFGITADAITGSQFFLSGSATGNQFFISASNFNIKANGDVTASSALFTGQVKARSFAEHIVIVTGTNSGSYFQTYNNGGALTRLIFDGSQAHPLTPYAYGDITLNLQLNVAPTASIGDIQLPLQAVGIYGGCNVIINCSGVTFDDAQVSGNMQSMGK